MRARTTLFAERTKRAARLASLLALACVVCLRGDGAEPEARPAVKPPAVGDWAMWRVRMDEWRGVEEIWAGVPLEKEPSALGAEMTIRIRIDAIDGTNVLHTIEWLSGKESLARRHGAALPSFFSLPPEGLERRGGKAMPLVFGSLRLEAFQTRWEYPNDGGTMLLITSAAVPIGPVQVRHQGLQIDLVAFGYGTGGMYESAPPAGPRRAGA